MILSVPANTTRPHTPGIRVEYKGGKGKPRLSRHPNSNVFQVTGNTKRRSIHATVANPAPASTMRAEVMREIEKAGIVIGEKLVAASGRQRAISKRVRLFMCTVPPKSRTYCAA